MRNVGIGDAVALVFAAIVLVGADDLQAQSAHGEAYVTAGPGRFADDGVGSVLVSIQDGKRSVRVQPFLLAGVGFLSTAIGDMRGAYIFGGGSKIWLTRRTGIRVDLRVPLGFKDQGGVTAGLGIAFR